MLESSPVSVSSRRGVLHSNNTHARTPSCICSAEHWPNVQDVNRAFLWCLRQLGGGAYRGQTAAPSPPQPHPPHLHATVEPCVPSLPLPLLLPMSGPHVNHPALTSVRPPCVSACVFSLLTLQPPRRDPHVCPPAASRPGGAVLFICSTFAPLLCLRFPSSRLSAGNARRAVNSRRCGVTASQRGKHPADDPTSTDITLRRKVKTIQTRAAVDLKVLFSSIFTFAEHVSRGCNWTQTGEQSLSYFLGWLNSLENLY